MQRGTGNLQLASGGDIIAIVILDILVPEDANKSQQATVNVSMVVCLVT